MCIGFNASLCHRRNRSPGLTKKIGKAIEKEVVNEVKKEFKKDKKDNKSNQNSQSQKQDNSKSNKSTNTPTDLRSINVPISEVYTNAQFYNDGVTGAQTVIDGIVYFILADRHHAYAKGPEDSMKKKLSHVKIWGGIRYKGVVYPVTYIAAGAFLREPITSVELPSTLQEIRERSFMHTQLKSVVIPASTWRIGASSFAATPIESVRMSNGVRKIEGSAFAGCYKLARVMLPESVTNIDRNVFYECEKLKTIYVHEKHKTLEVASKIFMGTNNILTSENLDDSKVVWFK